jgi:hypothetical protein
MCAQVTDLQATIEKLRMELVEREAVMADSYDTLSGLRRKVCGACGLLPC